MTEIAIIGAGPYGLSIAAHLAAREIPFRIFGKPMASWSEHMPKGMHLKSEGFASSLSHPRGEFTLKDYCAREGIAYKDVALPVKLETFVAYGRAFQKKFVPNLEEKLVTRLDPSPLGFQLVLDNQEKVLARYAIVATGITNFGWIPEILRSLPIEMISHSSQHGDLTQFRGRRVAVVGSGASALDLATLLHEEGASVELVSRRATIPFYDQPRDDRPLRARFRRPQTSLGQGGWEMLFFVHAPGLFRLLPESMRLDQLRKILGPSSPWHVRDRIAGKIPFHLGIKITAASVEKGRVRLELMKEAAGVETIEVDHVIAATGYRADLDRLSFLDTELRRRIRLTAGAPLLSAKFESSVPGLYFVGLSAANTFGPLLRFACGASFTAGHLARHFARQIPHAVPMPIVQDIKV